MTHFKKSDRVRSLRAIPRLRWRQGTILSLREVAWDEDDGTRHIEIQARIFWDGCKGPDSWTHWIGYLALVNENMMREELQRGDILA